MIKSIYSIYDTTGEIYSGLILMDERVVDRTFNFWIREQPEEACVDRVLMYLGSFDDETGEIIKAMPKQRLDLWSMKKKHMEAEHG